jgi:hypothetical protein
MMLVSPVVPDSPSKTGANGLDEAGTRGAKNWMPASAGMSGIRVQG